MGRYLTTLRFGMPTDGMQPMLSAIIAVYVRPCCNNNNKNLPMYRGFVCFISSDVHRGGVYCRTSTIKTRETRVLAGARACTYVKGRESLKSIR